MVSRAQSLAVTTDGRIIRRRSVEDVGSVDFLRLLEGLDQTEVRRSELGLVEVVVDSLASDRVAKGDFRVLLVVDEPLTSAVIEGGLATFSLELGETQETHFSSALQSHLRFMLYENLVILRRDHFVLAFHAPESGKQKVLNGTEIDSHLPCSLRRHQWCVCWHS